MSPKEPNEESRENSNEVTPQVTPPVEDLINDIATMQANVDAGIAWVEENFGDLGNNTFAIDAAPIFEQLQNLNNLTVSIPNLFLTNESQDSFLELNELLQAIIPQGSNGEPVLVNVNNDSASLGGNPQSGEGADSQAEDEDAQGSAENEQEENPDDGC